MTCHPNRSGYWSSVVVAVGLLTSSCTTAADTNPPVASESTDSETTPTSASTPTTAGDPGDESSASTDTTLVDTAPSTRLTGSYGVEVISTRPHDPNAFTQGLELHDGLLLESTGIYGESDRRWVDPQTGEVLELVVLDDELFGEGITQVGDTVYQLTWRAGRLLIADADELTELTFETYGGEGWGLCSMGDQFIMSNGSSELAVRNVSDFELIRTVEVIDANGNPINALNELECVGDQVLANIWRLDVIVAIDPTTGAVDAVIDAASIRPANAPIDDSNFALNGIAYDAETGNYLLTGKRWDTLYEVSFTPS